MQQSALRQVNGNAKLQHQYAKRDVLGERLVAHQSLDLRVRLEYGHAARAVRLFGMHPQKVVCALRIKRNDSGQPSFAIDSDDALLDRTTRKHHGAVVGSYRKERLVIELILLCGARALVVVLVDKAVIIVGRERGGRIAYG